MVMSSPVGKNPYLGGGGGGGGGGGEFQVDAHVDELSCGLIFDFTSHIELVLRRNTKL
jgi:hypothetical protein